MNETMNETINENEKVQDFVLDQDPILESHTEKSINDSDIEKKSPKVFKPITPQEYLQNPLVLDKLKLPELRSVLKHYKQMLSFEITQAYLNILENYGTDDIRRMKQNIKSLYNFALSGTKPAIQSRIRSFFLMWKSALKIQTRFRGFMVRYSQVLRGPAISNRSLCVNETDFYTLEPLNEIFVLDFFSYKTQDGFIYGFDSNSIRAQMKSCSKNNKKLNNPYTREPMKDLLPRIRKLGRFSKILNVAMYGPPQRSTPSSPPVQNTVIPNGPFTSLTTLIQRSVSQQNINIRSNVAMLLPVEYNHEEMVAKLREIRTKTFLERVRLLFMEYYHLGQYTEENWFLQLSDRDFARLYRTLHDNWHFRSGLSFRVKVSICPLWDPFIMQTAESLTNDTNEESIEKRMCLNIMEEMAYTGINDDYRLLGVFHSLTALTFVSTPARNSMMWLFESMR